MDSPLHGTPSPLGPGHSTTSAFFATVLTLALIVTWEATGLDLPMERLFGDRSGFALRDHWLFSTVLYELGRWGAWGAVTALSLGVWWPWGALRTLSTSRRVQLALTCLVSVALVAAIKSTSATSCPWDLQEFGGYAHLISHWDWWTEDGGRGQCFPAGHASSGFAFIGGWFAFSPFPRRALGWLVASVAAGLVFGVAQQIRGAHFMSHTLWTGWLCWVVAWVIDLVWPLVGPKGLA